MWARTQAIVRVHTMLSRVQHVSNACLARHLSHEYMCISYTNWESSFKRIERHVLMKRPKLTEGFNTDSTDGTNASSCWWAMPSCRFTASSSRFTASGHLLHMLDVGSGATVARAFLLESIRHFHFSFKISNVSIWCCWSATIVIRVNGWRTFLKGIF